jgi:hypothetical protein
VLWILNATRTARRRLREEKNDGRCRADMDTAGAGGGVGCLGIDRYAAAQALWLPGPQCQCGAGIEIVQFNPKIVVYDVLGPAGTSARIDYYDADANTHELNAALPWSTTISTTLPAISANIMVQGDSDQIGRRITVDGTVRDEKSTDGVNAQTFCLVKSA